MNIFKTIIFVIACFQITIASAQKYPFIPASQRLLSTEEVKTVEIMITPDVLLFSERGELLPMQKMELLSNPDYTPRFYVDANKKIQSVVFQKKSNQPIYIQENPEAYFENGERALDFITNDIDGNRVKLSDLKGDVVVLNFWFTKCHPCVDEMPNLNKLVKQYEDKNVTFLAITFNSKDTVEKFLKSHTFDYTIVPDATDVISTYAAQSFPTSMVINKNGEIVLKEIGLRNNIHTVLSDAIDSALN